MPSQKTQSALFNKLGSRLHDAAEKHKYDEIDYGQMSDLPAGIEGGVARLVDCKFTTIKEGKQNAGEYIFYAAGVVLEPVTFQGQHIQGLRTQISEPVFDTPGRARETIEEHVAEIQQHMKRLGASPESLSGIQLEDTAAALKAAQPCFRFRTWKGDKLEIIPKNGKFYCNKVFYPSLEAAQKANPFAGREPRVNHVWTGRVTYNGDLTDASASSAIQDNSPEMTNIDQVTGHEYGPADDVPDAGNGQNMGNMYTAPEVSLDELTVRADAQDSKAQDELTDIAMQLGITEEAVEEANNWGEVADLIRQAQTAAAASGPTQASELPQESSEADEPQNPWEPEKEQVYLYRPLDKSGKAGKRAVKVEVTLVNKKNRTVAVKDLSNPKNIWKGISWDDLLQQ